VNGEWRGGYRASLSPSLQQTWRQKGIAPHDKKMLIPCTQGSDPALTSSGMVGKNTFKNRKYDSVETGRQRIVCSLHNARRQLPTLSFFYTECSTVTFTLSKSASNFLVIWGARITRIYPYNSSLADDNIFFFTSPRFARYTVCLEQNSGVINPHIDRVKKDLKRPSQAGWC
jgi:hypothetical protein